MIKLSWTSEAATKRAGRVSVSAVVGCLVGLATVTGLSTIALSGGIDNAAAKLSSSPALPARQLGNALESVNRFQEMEADVEAAKSSPLKTDAPTDSQDGGLPVDIDERSKTLAASYNDAATAGGDTQAQPTGLPAAEDLLKDTAHPELPAQPGGNWPSTKMGPPPIFSNPAEIVSNARTVISFLVVAACIVGFLMGCLAMKVMEIMGSINRMNSLTRLQRNVAVPQLRIVRADAATATEPRKLPQPKWMGQELESAKSHSLTSRRRAAPTGNTAPIRRYIEI